MCGTHIGSDVSLTALSISSWKYFLNTSAVSAVYNSTSIKSQAFSFKEEKQAQTSTMQNQWTVKLNYLRDNDEK